MKYLLETIAFGLAVTLVIVLFKGEPPMLQQDALSQPEAITDWLKQNANVDRTKAERFFNYGVKAKGEQRWSPASKAFGESAVHFPTPQALNEYANAWLHMIHRVRTSPGNAPTAAEPDLEHVEKIFRSALAANEVLNSLNAQEKEQIERDASCLTKYLQSHEDIDCRPLQIYRHGN